MKVQFCEAFNNNNFYSQFNVKKATKQSLFEKFCLFFIQTKVTFDALENITTKYKVFRGKIFIIEQFVTPQNGYNCRHKLTKTK